MVFHACREFSDSTGIETIIVFMLPPSLQHGLTLHRIQANSPLQPIRAVLAHHHAQLFQRFEHRLHAGAGCALAHQPLPAEAIAARFKRTPRTGVQAVLEALEELGMVAHEDGAYRLQG